MPAHAYLEVSGVFQVQSDVGLFASMQLHIEIHNDGDAKNY